MPYTCPENSALFNSLADLLSRPWWEREWKKGRILPLSLVIFLTIYDVPYIVVERQGY
jgi:hypothetical protein